MEENSQNIPKKIPAKINYRIIGAICAAGIAYQVYAFLNHDYVIKNFTILDIPWILNPLGIGIAGLIVSKRYWGSVVFGKTYLSLGIGFLCYFLGSSIYEYMSDFLNQTAYPSYPDIFFLAFYPFLYYHLIRNIKYFKRKIQFQTKLGLGILACGMAILFTYMTLLPNPPIDLTFYVSEAYVILDAAQLSLVVLGAMVFRQSILGNAWLLLVTGFLIYTISDYWYYYSSNFNMYDESHPVNALFQVGFMITIYALYMHKKLA